VLNFKNLYNFCQKTDELGDYNKNRKSVGLTEIFLKFCVSCLLVYYSTDHKNCKIGPTKRC